MKTQQISKSSAALLLFLTEGKIGDKITRAEHRALSRGCDRLDELFDDDDEPPVRRVDGGVVGKFDYADEPVEVKFTNQQYAVLTKVILEAEREHLTRGSTRGRLVKLEDQWGLPETDDEEKTDGGDE